MSVKAVGEKKVKLQCSTVAPLCHLSVSRMAGNRITDLYTTSPMNYLLRCYALLYDTLWCLTVYTYLLYFTNSDKPEPARRQQ